MTSEQGAADANGSATIDTKPQHHPYLVATITPSGGLIVHMHWVGQPAEPLAFTNEADFSAWLKGAVGQCSQRIPPGIRPPQRPLPRAGSPSLTHAPSPFQGEDDIEFEPAQPPRAQRRGIGERLGSLVGGGRS